jgi:integrase
MKGSVLCGKCRKPKNCKCRTDRWSLVFDLGFHVDPKTGAKRRRQKWVSFRGTKTDAQKKLRDLLGQTDSGTFVEPAKLTVIEWLRSWLGGVQRLRRPRTYSVYRSVVEGHVAKSGLAGLLLQRLTPSDLEAYYASLKAAPATVALHHAVIRCALDKAVRDHKAARNVAKDKVERPKAEKGVASATAREQCWSALEARRFLDAAKDATAQAAAFFALALDTGARKAELAGLTWAHMNFDAGRVTFAQQLLGDDADGLPVFGPTKTGHARDVTISPQTVGLLRAHKAQQAALKLRNRTSYVDADLVFAKEHGNLQTPRAKLGQPLPVDRLARFEFHRLVKAAGVKRIVFHGLRHTTATLLLQAGTPIKNVADRLGHANASMTLDVYAHALPDQQQAAAERLGGILHG